MKYFKLGLLSILIILFTAFVSSADVVKGKVASVQGEFIEIDIGSSSGIAAGDTGRAYYTVKIGPDEKTIYLAKFKVVSLKELTCRARIEESTSEVKVGHLVEIDVKLSTTGELEVKSDPSGAKVYLDGKDMGVTPLTLSRIRPKQYLIRVTKEGYDPYEVNVEIAGAERKTVLAYLEKLKKEGRLVIRTDPTGATVYIDGQSKGKSPYEGKGITPGSYKVKVIKEGYEAWERDVPVESGKTVEILARLKEGPPGPRPGEGWRDSITGIEFVYIKGGCFEMGCGSWTNDCLDHEKPVHEVCVNDFYVGKYEVTVGQFRKFVNDTGYRTEAERGDGCFSWAGQRWEKQSDKNWRNPGFSQNDAYPVVCVSHNDVTEYVKWMSVRSNLKYRLPTEAEWEYAARSGGKREKFAGFYDVNELSQYGNFCDRNCKLPYKTEGQNDGYEFTAPVGRFRPNGLGLYDMSGNVWEWCQDWYEADYYRSSPRSNPEGPNSGQGKVLRGGSWINDSRFLRASYRSWTEPTYRYYIIGFRLVLSSK